MIHNLGQEEISFLEEVFDGSQMTRKCLSDAQTLLLSEFEVYKLQFCFHQDQSQHVYRRKDFY